MIATIDSADGWELNFDSAPFCNGSLHLGHVRNYVLGDVRARWLRSNGIKTVYRSAFDTFGVPNEQGALSAGVPPETFVRTQVSRIRDQMSRLALSYTGESLPCYSQPEVYRWTQWLFLRLWSAGLVYRRRATSSWCCVCDSFLADAQAHGGKCWRCGVSVVRRDSVHWYVRTSHYGERLYRGIDQLSGWSPRARRLLRSYMDWLAVGRTDGTIERDRAEGVRDWMVSRNRSWGTPLPAVDCPRCGLMAVDEACLPVRLPVHGGSGFERCLSCEEYAPLTKETLDCFFDDAWCFFGAVPHTSDQNPFEAWRQNPPSRVHLNAGFDSFAYLHYFRFVGYAVYDLGYSPRPEPVDFYSGHDVVKAGGKKMSKNYGNAPDLDALLDARGPDVVRLSTLVNTNPDKPICWTHDRLDHSRSIINVVERYLESQAVCKIFGESEACDELDRVGRFVAGYRIGAAIDSLFKLTRRIVTESVPGYAPERSSVHDRIAELWSLFLPYTCGTAGADRPPASRHSRWLSALPTS